MNLPISIANYFIAHSLNTGMELTPMKLVKLVYISHGWYLALKDEPLISEGVQAWKYGPVIPSLYHRFKKYKNNQITALETDENTHKIQLVTDYQLQIFLNKIIEVYKNFSGTQLSTLTHQDGTPWDIVWNKSKGKEYEGAVVPNDLIKQHYQSKANATS